MRFKGQSAVVTGGTRGIGRAIASQLAWEGASVLLTGTDGAQAEKIAQDISSETGGSVWGTRCEVSDQESVRTLAETAKRLFSTVDVLVNNAAIARRNRIGDITLSEWNEVMAVNATGTFLVTRDVLPLMTTGYASIVNVSSQSGKRGEALLSHYATSKAAQICMTKSFALELAPAIRVNAVCPGYIETDMILEHYEVQAGLRGLKPTDIKDEMLARIPLGRMQEPHTIADLVLFLASDQARDLTGQAINISGGMVMD
ncbi:3-oxoacyl-(acyl-carrier-protein) reductase FabG [Arthrobacter sp. 9V]|uniref:SDR family oxidoreductase n=1 Tax=Arthrobacter sp. 9V TaxID=2653132 RepID=UPI0012F32AB0|nr:SDR family NAD(P)-dependent oxidoreductase [Arthrobacter sp. 9V]VXC43313.1 3-oxoacyl-(acyl-carrier-protein) reductase FabG [Arthrobacter sp. 9V]